MLRIFKFGLLFLAAYFVIFVVLNLFIYVLCPSGCLFQFLEFPFYILSSPGIIALYFQHGELSSLPFIDTILTVFGVNGTLYFLFGLLIGFFINQRKAK